MALSALNKRFILKCFVYRRRIHEIVALRSVMEPWKICYLTESLISDIWQSWCSFCRQLILLSCQGVVARDGGTIHKRSADNSNIRVAYEAKQYSSNKQPKITGHNNFLKRHEPTWGDLDALIKIINGLMPSNAVNLLSAVGSFSRIKELQKLRNACAHKNNETINEIKSMHITYGSVNTNFVAELAFFVTAGTMLIEIWLYEMEMIAGLATAKP